MTPALLEYLSEEEREIWDRRNYIADSDTLGVLMRLAEARSALAAILDGFSVRTDCNGKGCGTCGLCLVAMARAALSSGGKQG